MAAAVYGAYHWADYALFRGLFLVEMHQQILAETGLSDPDVASVMVDYALRQETGFAGFPGYLLFTARQGITIGKAFRSGLHLGPFFTWVFWLLEWAIIGWVAVSKAKGAAAKPFCEACVRWYGEEQHLGGVGAALAAELEVYLQSCRHCSSSEAWLAFKPVTLGENGGMQFQPATAISIRPHERAGLLGALNSATETS